MRFTALQVALILVIIQNYNAIHSTTSFISGDALQLTSTADFLSQYSFPATEGIKIFKTTEGIRADQPRQSSMTQLIAGSFQTGICLGPL